MKELRQKLISTIKMCLSINVNSCSDCPYKNISSPRCKVQLLKDVLNYLEKENEE